MNCACTSCILFLIFRAFLRKICVKRCPDGEMHICAVDRDVRNIDLIQ